MKKIHIIETFDTNPYHNLALEEALLKSVKPEECILYLWQNRQTVVIGRNQNALAECKVQKLEADGGFLARRLSGGGAVFHDLGNLNFTFLACADWFSKEIQTDIIIDAIRSLGIDAEKNGRNDLTVNGQKFSGHAYYKTKDKCYHHGTIMLD
ncbi:MAG: lipoate--protein ligase, partial [Ruminococcus sp.]|nr:lipoate--protein ligase [Candidatus Copronaster equi]